MVTVRLPPVTCPLVIVIWPVNWVHVPLKFAFWNGPPWVAAMNRPLITPAPRLKLMAPVWFRPPKAELAPPEFFACVENALRSNWRVGVARAAEPPKRIAADPHNIVFM